MMFSSDEEGAAENTEEETSVEVDLGNVVVVDTAMNLSASEGMTSQTSQKSASQSSRKSGKEVTTYANQIFFMKLYVNSTFPNVVSRSRLFFAGVDIISQRLYS